MSASVRTTRSRARQPSSASASSLPSKPTAPRSKSASKPPASAAPGKKRSTKDKGQLVQDVWCICRGPDDRTPMIRCESCKDWFHFACINLSERDAEDIQLYICDTCHGKTGQTTVYEWEGPDAVVGVEDGAEVPASDENTIPTNGKADQSRTKAGEGGVAVDDDPGDEDEEVEEASGDDYKEEEPRGSVVIRRGRAGQIITSSDEDGGGDEDALPSLRAASRRAQLKRKRGREYQAVQRKRPRKPSEVGTDDEDEQSEKEKKRKRGNNKAKAKHESVMDPTRKYCLGKLRDVLVPIFVQFASASQVPTDRGEGGSAIELNEEQKLKAEEDGAAYVKDLEQCLFETYGELDKHGDRAAGGKYKDRFRMLSFNLSQPDRHLLRRNIGTHALPALQLAKMSSVELANEQTKLQIEAANRESLEHSILKQRPIAARAKITHKGEEIIEDLMGDDIGRRIQEEEQRETERERGRERGAIEKAKMPPPPTPAPQKEKLSFKGPQDILAQQHNAASQKAAQAQAAHRPPLFTASSSLAEIPAEPSFKFDDLIAIDLPDDSPPQESPVSGADEKPVPSASPNDVKPEVTFTVAQADDPLESKDGSASFDLNNVWSGPASSENGVQESTGSPRPDHPRDPPGIDIDLGTAADDEDFDMFLDQPEVSSNAPAYSGPEAEHAAFEALPIVWNGHLILPDAGKLPAVQARQVGGRSIDSSSNQWHTLFPAHLSNQLKVDGRVPVKESAKYMTQNRMNTTRELIVVALTPLADRTDFDEVVSFLVNRDRHAVVHPWGPNPSPDAPGKELYLIPIMPHEVLPEYVEILDLVKFPKRRDDKILLGVFVLNKGKFSERIPSTPLQPSDSTPAVLPTATTTGVSNASSALPRPAQQTAPAIPPEVVSKLTTQQIESLLQSVLSGGLSSMPSAQTQPPPNPPPFPPTFPPSVTNVVPQQYPTVPFPPYAHTGMTTPPQYPPLPQHPPSASYNYNPPAMPPSPSRTQDYRGPPHYGGDYGTPGRGEYGRPRGSRGAGRSFSNGERGRGNRGDFAKPLDSGWAGRGRGRGGSGQSPPRPW